MEQGRRKRGLLVVAIAVLVIVASATCGPSAPVEEGPALAGDTPPAPTVAPTRALPTEPAEEEEAVSVLPTPTPEAPPAGTETEQMAGVARADLAGRLEVREEEVLVKSVEAVDWPDTSLGCPQPGMMYAQVITPGYRVVLEVEGQSYEVHTDGAQNAVLCEEEAGAMEVPAVPGTVEPGMEPLIKMAKEDLAGRLSIDVEEIEVLEAKAVVWPDSSLGCPQPGMRYLQVPMDGALIRLEAEGKVYEYHSGGSRDPFLCEQPLKLQKDTVPQIDLLKLTPPAPSE